MNGRPLRLFLVWQVVVSDPDLWVAPPGVLPLRDRLSAGGRKEGWICGSRRASPLCRRGGTSMTLLSAAGAVLSAPAAPGHSACTPARRPARTLTLRLGARAREHGPSLPRFIRAKALTAERNRSGSGAPQTTSLPDVADGVPRTCGGDTFRCAHGGSASIARRQAGMVDYEETLGELHGPARPDVCSCSSSRLRWSAAGWPALSGVVPATRSSM